MKRDDDALVEVANGVFQIQLPNFKAPSNVFSYLINRGNDVVLVDCGWNEPETLEVLKKGLAKCGLKVEDITILVITHCHPDHYGLSGIIRTVSKAKIVMHEKEARILAKLLSNQDRNIARWLRTCGVPYRNHSEIKQIIQDSFTSIQSITADIAVKNGMSLEIGSSRFKVVSTPGHSPGHICLYDKTDHILIAGDHVLPNITPNIGIFPFDSGNPLKEYKASLNKISKLNVDLVLPGHGYHYKDLQSRIKEIQEHHNRRLSEVQEVINNNAKSIYEIASTLSWTTGGWDEFSSWEKIFALAETLSHAEFLRRKGEIKKLANKKGFLFRASLLR